MLSIIIVNYKSHDPLQKCLQSLYTSDSVRWEVIIIDNSPEESSDREFIQSFPEIIWIKNPRNLGFAKAVNIAIEKSKGEIFVLLNPDSIIFPETLNNIELFFQSNPKAGIIGGQLQNPDGSIQPQCRRNIPNISSAIFRLFYLNVLFPNRSFAKNYELPLENLDQIQAVPAVSGALMAFQRQLYEKIGGLDEGFFLFGEDLDYCYRSLLAGFENFYIPSIKAIHHRGLSRKKRHLRTFWNTHHAMARFYRKHQAAKNPIILNLVVYLGIWIRWSLFFSVGCLKMLFSKGPRN